MKRQISNCKVLENKIKNMQREKEVSVRSASIDEKKRLQALLLRPSAAGGRNRSAPEELSYL